MKKILAVIAMFVAASAYAEDTGRVVLDQQEVLLQGSMEKVQLLKYSPAGNPSWTCQEYISGYSVTENRDLSQLPKEPTHGAKDGAQTSELVNIKTRELAVRINAYCTRASANAQADLSKTVSGVTLPTITQSVTTGLSDKAGHGRN